MLYAAIGTFLIIHRLLLHPLFSWNCQSLFLKPFVCKHGRHTHTHIGSTCAVECRLCLTPVCCCTARVEEGELVLSGLALVVELRKPVCRGNAGVVEGIDSNTHLCIRHLFIHLHIHLPVFPLSTTLSIYMCARPRNCWGTLTLPQLCIHHFLLPRPLHESQVLIPPLPPFPILNWSQALHLSNPCISRCFSNQICQPLAHLILSTFLLILSWDILIQHLHSC